MDEREMDIQRKKTKEFMMDWGRRREELVLLFIWQKNRNGWYFMDNHQKKNIEEIHLKFVPIFRDSAVSLID